MSIVQSFTFLQVALMNEDDPMLQSEAAEAVASIAARPDSRIRTIEEGVAPAIARMLGQPEVR